MKVTLSLSKGSRDESMIRMRFSIPHTNCRPEISTGVKVSKRLWCQKAQQISLNNRVLKAHGTSAAEVALKNQQLNQVVAELTKLITARSIECFPSPPDPYRIKADYMRLVTGDKTEALEQLNILQAFERYIKRPNLSAGTIKNLNQTKNKVENYSNAVHASTAIKDIGHQWLLCFATCLTNGEFEAPLSKDTVANHLKRIRTVIESLDADQTKADDLRRKVSLGERKKVRKPVLTPSQIIAIRDFDFPTHTLNRARDWFVIQCWTGLRVSDLFDLSSEEVIEVNPGEWEIHHVQNKTNRPVEIPVHPDAAVVLARLQGLPRKMNKAQYAREIKKLCKRIGLNQKMEGYAPKPVTGRDGKLYLRNVFGTYPMWKLISTHTARRTAATNYLMNGAREVDVMSLTGHRTARQLYDYLHSTPAQHKANLKLAW
jgi:integrase